MTGCSPERCRVLDTFFCVDGGTLFASGFVNFLVNISDKVANAVIVSSQMVAKGASG
jgi:hypothetical protein